ncbi:MAG: flagellar hook assembly protein FlgD [Spirochaetaceae bacterium]|jgi:flagellar basal-body rod modification protein FlgD|nr:flagellar hook assembly protein FlgD [Spirochaetaceae bacterium]
MDIDTSLSAREMAETNRVVNEFNAKINEGKAKNQSLGRDDFLKLLVTQLSYQDPTAPMEDKEFIAQMAQFSSLEQMTNMASDFSKLAEIITGSEANSAIGKSVEIMEGDNTVQGTVKAVTRGGAPQILVNGNYYQWSQVTKIFEE